MNCVAGCLELEHMMGTNIFNILPEIWSKIIQYLNPSEFHSLLNSSLKLREDLKAERIKSLFPLILPILHKDQDCFDLHAFLDLRRVNHETKLAFETFLKDECCQEYWDYINVFPTNQARPWRPWLCSKLIGNCYYVTIDHVVGGAITEINNPFLARPLNISIALVSALRRQERLFSFLRRTGTNVIHLRCSDLRSICLVFSILSLVPNLRVLKLCTEEDVEDKEQFLMPIHYPLLPQLEFLDLEGFYDHLPCQENTRLNVAFVRSYGPQLKMLNCSNTLFRGWWGLGSFYCRHLCNLERLRVSNVGMEALIALSQANLPKLWEVHLSTPALGGGVYPERISIQKVVNVMNNFAQSLSHFHLNIPINVERSEEDSVDDTSVMILFPKLIIFTTCLSNVQLEGFWPIIQLRCPNLMELRLLQCDTMNEKSRTELHQNLQSIGFSLVPKLKRIWIAYRVFTPLRTPMWIRITRQNIYCHRTLNFKNLNSYL